MFLNNLSTASERKARKASDKKNKVKSDDDSTITGDILEGSSNPLLRRALPPSSSSHIQYDTNTVTIPRPILINFLETCVKMLLDEGNLLMLIHESIQQGIGLDHIMVNFQRDVMEYNFHIERNFGCRYLSTLGDKFPEDKELIEIAQTFMYACQQSYVEALKLRLKLYRKGDIRGPESGQPMGRTSILEFFEGCTALMILPETADELAKLHQRTKQSVNKRVIELQREVISWLGYDPDHGIQSLNRINRDYANDSPLMMKMQSFGLSAQIACQVAEMSAEQKQIFYGQMPPLMRPFPQMFVLHQQMQAMQAQQRAGGMPGGGVGNGMPGREAEIEALKQSGLLSLLTTPDGRTRVQQLSQRVQESRERVFQSVNTWNEEKKDDFLLHFSEQPLLSLLRETDESSGTSAANTTTTSSEEVLTKEDGVKAMQKMGIFMTMPDEQMDAAMTLLALLTEDQGARLQALRQKLSSSTPLGEGSDNGNWLGGDEETMKWMHTVATVMSSLATIRQPQHSHGAAGHGHDHSHSHGHGHDHDHGEHCGHQSRPPQTNPLAAPRAATMER